MDEKEIYPYLYNKNYYFFTCEGKEGEIQLNILNSIIKNWKVELNEIHRVEIK